MPKPFQRRIILDPGAWFYEMLLASYNGARIGRADEAQPAFKPILVSASFPKAEQREKSLIPCFSDIQVIVVVAQQAVHEFKRLACL